MVLLPRRTIAEGLSSYTSRLRGSEIGDAIGLGIGAGGAQWVRNGSTQILFATYGYFEAVTNGFDPAELSKWGVLILDEVHERTVSEDILLARLNTQGVLDGILATNPRFRVLLLSATMDFEEFAATFPAKYPPGKVVIDGLNFPVEEIFEDDDDDDDGNDGTQQNLLDSANLAHFAVQKFKKHNGNMLVFVARPQQAEELAAIAGDMLRSNRNVDTLVLHGKVDQHHRDSLTQFYKGGGNAGRHYICFATNIAEAGMTLPEIEVVIDTGTHLDVRYDIISGVSSIKVAPICQNSHRQRVGRAGRTCPGVCYNTFSESNLAARPVNEDPAIVKSDFTKSLLDLAKKGLSVDDLPDPPPPDVVQAAESHLKSFGAIDAGGTITELGKLMSSIPLKSTWMACSLAKAMELGVATEVLCILSVVEKSYMGPFESMASHKLQQDHPELGDLGCNLAAFQALDGLTDFDFRTKCQDLGLKYSAMIVAFATFDRVRSMLDADDNLAGYLDKTIGDAAFGQDIGKIIEALASGLFPMGAIARGPTRKDGFDRVVPGLGPTQMQSWAGDKDAPINSGQHVIFANAVTTMSGMVIGNGMVEVDAAVLLNVVPSDMQAIFQKAATEFKMVQFEVAVPLNAKGFVSVHIPTLGNMCSSVSRQFPGARANFDASPDVMLVRIQCRKAAQTGVAQYVNKLIKDSTLVKIEIDVPPKKDMKSYLQSRGQEPGQHVGALRTKYGLATPLLQFSYEDKPTARRWFLQALPQYINTILGDLHGGTHGDSPMPQTKFVEFKTPVAPKAAAADGDVAAGKEGAVPSQLTPEELKMQVLSATLPPDPQKWPVTMRLCWFLLHRHRLLPGKPQLHVYGGTVRDYILRDDLHDDLDLDVSVEGPPGETYTDVKLDVQGWAERQAQSPIMYRIDIPGNDSRVHGYYFEDRDSNQNQREVQMVCTRAFKKAAQKQNDALVDTDVSNLKVILNRQTGRAEIVLKEAQPMQPDRTTNLLGLEQIKARCRKKECYILYKTVNSKGDKEHPKYKLRRQKLLDRGWNVKHVPDIAY